MTPSRRPDTGNPEIGTGGLSVATQQLSGRPITLEGYRGIARGVAADRLGRLQLSEVGPKDFDDFYDRLRSRGLSPATVQRYHALLGGALHRRGAGRC
jgi:hypothetical protein